MSERIEYSAGELESIENYLRSHPELHENPWTFLIALGVMGERRGALQPEQIEIILREIDSSVFLLAIPINQNHDENSVALLPQTGDKEYPFFLSATLAETSETLRILQDPIFAAENLLRLANTGILTQRKLSVANGI